MRATLLSLLLAASAVAVAPVAVSSAAAAPAVDGALVYRDNCGRCHPARAPNELEPGQWRAVTFHMRTRAMLTRAEMLALEAFLTAPPQPAAGARVLANPVLAERCVVCHDPARIEDAVSSGRPFDQWHATLERMRTYGAQITPQQADELARWLADQGQQASPK